MDARVKLTKRKTKLRHVNESMQGITIIMLQCSPNYRATERVAIVRATVMIAVYREDIVGI